MYAEGIRAFYKGFTLNIFKTPLALSTAWTIKNALNRKLDDHYDFWVILITNQTYDYFEFSTNQDKPGIS